MSATTHTRVKRMRFAIQLRAALDDQGISVRSLAKRINPQTPETARSNLMRWLRGSHMPSRTSRRAVAVALGLEPAHFETAANDDEDEDPVADLMEALRALVRQTVAESNAPAAHLTGSTAGALTTKG